MLARGAPKQKPGDKNSHVQRNFAAAQSLAEAVLALPCPGMDESVRELVAGFIGLGNAFTQDRLGYAVSFRELIASCFADDSEAIGAGPSPENVASVIARIDGWVVSALQALSDGDERFSKPLLALFGNVVWVRQSSVLKDVNRTAHSKLGAVANGIEQDVYRSKGLGTSLGGIGAQLFAKGESLERSEYMLGEDIFTAMIDNVEREVSARKVTFQMRGADQGELRKAIMAAILWLLNLAAEPRFHRRVKRTVKRSGGRFKAAPLKDVLETAEELSRELKAREKQQASAPAASLKRTANIDGTRCGVAYGDAAALARGYDALSATFSPLSVKNTFDPSFDAPAKTSGYRFILMTTLHVDPDKLTWGDVLDDVETKREWKTVVGEFCASTGGRRTPSDVDWEVVLTEAAQSLVTEPRLREKPFAFMSEIQVLHTDYLKMRNENRLWFKLERSVEPEALWREFARYCPD